MEASSPCNGNHFLVGERSEPLSRVFNDQTSGIYIYMVESVRMYVFNTHARVRMSVCYLDRNVSLPYTLYFESSISLEGGRSKDIVRLCRLSSQFKNFHTRNCSLI